VRVTLCVTAYLLNDVCRRFKDFNGRMLWEFVWTKHKEPVTVDHSLLKQNIDLKDIIRLKDAMSQSFRIEYNIDITYAPRPSTGK